VHTLTAIAVIVLLLLLELGFMLALFAPEGLRSLVRVWRFPLATLIILSLYALGTAMANQTPTPAARNSNALAASRDVAAQRASIPTVYVATSAVSDLSIYDHPDGSAEQTLASPNSFGFPLTLLVKRVGSGWLDVYLPTRPNGSTGWVRLSDVKLRRDPYAVIVNLTAKRITVLNGSRAIVQAPVGVGRALTPTPSGIYFVTDILKQPDPSGVYGPYAIGLSAHSTVLNEFDGGDGQVGLHGTDFPEGIGTNVSHGCVRMANTNIVTLANTLPLGTPVILTRRSI
jgi:lipoprotein-anchoring transpeptidase ErfK/SrfK